MVDQKKILYITDLHISNKNLDDVEVVIQAIKKYKKVSLIIIGGDIRNRKYFDSECADKAKELIKVCSRVAITYVLVGNHDYIDNFCFLSDEHWMNDFKNWPNVFIVDTVTTILCGFQITCVPYVPNGRFVEALECSKTPWKDSRLIFAHQEIKGCNLGNKVSTRGDFWDPTYPTLISGHIHDEQKVNNNVIYPGSTINQGTQNKQQKILFINTSCTSDGEFKYELKTSFIHTKMREIIFVQPNNLFYINQDISKNLTNTIFIIDEDDYYKIGKIKLSQDYIQLFNRSRYVCFGNY